MSARTWGIIFLVIFALAAISVVIKLIEMYWWAFLIAGVIVACAWIYQKYPRTPTTPGVVATIQPSDQAMQTHSVPTLRGEMVRSRGEARVADLLFRKGIEYDYEPTIGGFRPDFYVSQWNLIIEYWGMDDDEYNRKRRIKTDAYLNLKYHLISLEGKDWPNLEGELMRRLYRFDKDIFNRNAISS